MSKLKSKLFIAAVGILFFTSSFAAESTDATKSTAAASSAEKPMSSEDFTKKVKELDAATQERLNAAVAKIIPERKPISHSGSSSATPSPAAASSSAAPAAPIATPEAAPSQPYTPPGFSASPSTGGTDTSGTSGSTSSPQQLDMHY